VRVFFTRRIAGIRTRRRQIDVRFDGWLPFSVRYGYNTDFGRVIRVPVLGWAIVIGKLKAWR
jgi:hypothetical protein